PAGVAVWGIGALAARGFTGWLPVLGVAVAFFLFGLIEVAARNGMIRRAYAMTKRSWGAPSRGGYWGHLFFVVVVRLFGPGVTYLVLYPIALYFVFAAPENRRASMEYLDRVLGPAAGLARWVR